MKKYKLIIFDWDGTLADSPLKIVRSFQRAAEDAGLKVPDDDVIRYTIGMSIDPTIEKVFGVISDEQKSKFIERYRYQFHHPDGEAMPLFKGVKEGLDKLAAEGYWLTVATGKARQGLDFVLKQNDLTDMFMFSRCADESRSKPHPQMLLDVLDYTGVEGKDALMIGDTTHDINMANSAKVDGLAVSYGAHDKSLLLEAKPVAIVDNFNQVMDFILK